MTLLATERIKLFSTRSPWWSMAMALVLSVGFAGLLAANATSVDTVTVSSAESGYPFALAVMMIMAALAVTTEYRFGTIRVTFQAVPNRTLLLLAKTAVAGVVAAAVGEVSAFASWAVAKAIHPGPALVLANGQAWRDVAGMGLVFLVTAVIGIAVGILVRQTAGAVAILLIYALLVENLVRLVPKIGSDVRIWLPFTMANNFLTGGGPQAGGLGGSVGHMPLAPWMSLGYFAGVAAVLLTVALITANRRDA